MALFEDITKGGSSTLLLGIGVAIVAPIALPAFGSMVRPLAKTFVKGGVMLYDAVRGPIAEAGEQFNDLTTEARAELAGSAGTKEASAGPPRERAGKPKKVAVTRTKGRL